MPRLGGAFTVSLLAFITAAGPAFAQFSECNIFRFDRTIAYGELRHSVVKLGSSGAAFLIDPELGLFITAGHVLDESGGVGMAQPHAYSPVSNVTLREIASFDELDLALAIIEGENVFSDVVGFEITTRDTSDRAMGLLNIAEAVGGPGGIMPHNPPAAVEMQLFEGVIEGQCVATYAKTCCTRKCFAFSSAQNLGDSGGPLFNEFGLAHGVLIEKGSKQGYAAPLAYSIPTLIDGWRNLGEASDRPSADGGDRSRRMAAARQKVDRLIATITELVVAAGDEKTAMDDLMRLLSPYSQDSLSNFLIVVALHKVIEGADAQVVPESVGKALACAAWDRGLPSTSFDLASRFNIKLVQDLTHPARIFLGQAATLLASANNKSNWAMPTGNYENWHWSELDQINRHNVEKLQVAWNMSTGVLRGHEGGPLVVGDTMYLTTPFPNIVYAVDLAADGHIKWRYEPQQDPDVISVMANGVGNPGVAYAPAEDGRASMILLQQANTELVALDAVSGKVIWRAVNSDSVVGASASVAPIVVKDMVITGVSGAEFGVRGHLTAYNLVDGSRLWRAYSTGPDEEMLFDPERTTHLGRPVGPNSSLDSWEGDQWRIGGGTTSGWISYDPDLDLIYYGTEGPAPWNAAQRPGDNRWTNAIVARNPDTGIARWVYQTTPHNEWSFSAASDGILIDEPSDDGRKLLVSFSPNGFAYTLDRGTGELILAEKYDPSVNWATDVVTDPDSDQYGRPQIAVAYSTEAQGEDVNALGICPAGVGTKNRQPAAFSPRTGLLYVPTSHACMDYEPFRVSYKDGQPYVGATLSMFPAPDSHGGLGNFIAWDGTKGKVAWSLPEPFTVWSGALATAGDVVFYGTLEGYLKAVDAGTGEELSRFKVPSGIIGNVMTYEHAGKQYIAVLSGVGGWAGIPIAEGLTNPGEGLGSLRDYPALSDNTNLAGQLTVFALPE